MGLICAKGERKPKKPNGANRQIYLLDADGQGVSSMSVHGVVKTRPELSEETIQIVADSWKIIKQDIQRVGVVTFMGLLEDDDVKSTFIQFRNKATEELLTSKTLRAHALRVMTAVDKVVARIREPENLTVMLHELGSKHVEYNAKAEFLDLVGPQFINAVQPALGDQWSDKIEQAWADVFCLVTHIMREAMVM